MNPKNLSVQLTFPYSAAMAVLTVLERVEGVGEEMELLQIVIEMLQETRAAVEDGETTEEWDFSERAREVLGGGTNGH